MSAGTKDDCRFVCISVVCEIEPRCDLSPLSYRQLATVLKVLLRSVPTRVNAPIAATAINAAIKAYSIAVTPDSSLRRPIRKLRTRVLLGWVIACSVRQKL